MARKALSVLDISLAGSDPHPTAGNVDGHSVPWSRDVAAVIRNSNTSPMTVTVGTPGTVNGLALSARTTPVPANSTRIIPLGCAEYRQPDGSVHLDYSSVTTVTVGVIRLPKL